MLVVMPFDWQVHNGVRRHAGRAALSRPDGR